MDRVALRSRTRDYLLESGTEKYTDASLNDWLNEGYVDVCRRTGALHGYHDFNSVDNTSEYVLPDDLVIIRAVLWDPLVTNRWLVPARPFEIEQADPRWRNRVKGTVSSYTVIGLRGLVLHRAPTTVTKVRIWGSWVPRSGSSNIDGPDLDGTGINYMTSDSHSPVLPEARHILLACFAASRAAMTDPEDPAMVKRAEIYAAMYERGVQEMKSEVESAVGVGPVMGFPRPAQMPSLPFPWEV